MASVEHREAIVKPAMKMYEPYPVMEKEKDSDEESFHLPLLEIDDVANDKDLENGETEEDILNKFVEPEEEDVKITIDNNDLVVDNETESTVENQLDEAQSMDEKYEKTDLKLLEMQHEQIEIKKEQEEQPNKEQETNKIEVKELIKSEIEEPNKDEVEELIKDEVEEVNKDEVEEANKAEVEEANKVEEEEANKDEEKKANKDEEEEANKDEEEEANKYEEEEANKNEKEESNKMEVEEPNKDEETEPNKIEESGGSEEKTDENMAAMTETLEDEDKKEGEVPQIPSPSSNSVDCESKTEEEKEEDTVPCNIAVLVPPKETLPDTNEASNEEQPVNNDEAVKESEPGPSRDKTDNLGCDDLLDISVICDVDEDNAKAAADSANDARNSDKSDNDDQEEDKTETEMETETSETQEPEQDQDLENMDHDGTPDEDMEHDHQEHEEQDEQDQEDSEDRVGDLRIDFDTESTSNDKGMTSESEKLTETDELTSNDGSGTNTTTIRTLSVASFGCESGSFVDEEKSVDGDIQPRDLFAQSEHIEILDLDQHMAEQKSLKESAPLQSSKRSLSVDSITDPENTSKKQKLASDMETTQKQDSIMTTLSNFSDFMRGKVNKISKSDLEQFCLQKFCEVLMHNTPIGEQYQTNKKQEQIIESLRKEVQQLTKQVKDLDIVNKKLINEIKNQNGMKKPLVPLKITRSVGLQVKLNSVADVIKRKSQGTTPVRHGVIATPTLTPSPTMAINRSRTQPPTCRTVVRQIAPNPTPPRKITTVTKQTQSPQATNTPLLSQVLQSPTRTMPALLKRTPSAPRPSKEAGVIDLTDEDDKLGKTKVINKAPANKVQIPMQQNRNKVVKSGQMVGSPARNVTTLAPGVRLTPTTVKNGIAIPASVVTSTGGPQLMYVVPTSQIVTSTAGGTPKAVLLNFQPSNGLITNSLNTSTVSVIPAKPTPTSSIQLKPIHPRRHPAPLPAVPIVPMAPHLKPILPKPHLTIRKTDNGIILQWRMPYNLDQYETIASYQLYAYQETSATPSTEMWRKVGDVKALALPMACTLTQFADKNKYYFAVRSVDVHKRIGAFSDPEEISL